MLDEIPPVIKQYTKTFDNSTKMTPIQASGDTNEKLVRYNLRDNREIQKPKFQQGQVVPTADIKKVFSKGDITNSSHKL